MARNVTIDLDLLKRIDEKEGKWVVLTLFSDGSGSVDFDGKRDYPHAISFGLGESPNLAMEAYLKPELPTLMDDLNEVYDDCDGLPGSQEAYERLFNHLKKETE